jgi:hypothetical protein
MEVMYLIQVVTMLLCWTNYGLCLYRSKWDFADISTVGWLMAVLGWTNVVF